MAQEAARWLANAGCDPETAHSEAAALLALERGNIDAMLCAVTDNVARALEMTLRRREKPLAPTELVAWMRSRSVLHRRAAW